jgi:hypothetical protein
VGICLDARLFNNAVAVVVVRQNPQGNRILLDEFTPKQLLSYHDALSVVAVFRIAAGKLS